MKSSQLSALRNRILVKCCPLFFLVGCGSVATSNPKPYAVFWLDNTLPVGKWMDSEHIPHRETDRELRERNKVSTDRMRGGITNGGISDYSKLLSRE
jgi:hypothetical protein